MIKKTILLHVLMIICLSVYAGIPEEFKNFPNGSEPEFIASKIIQLYNNAAESTTPINYPETCSWFGSLRFAGATKDNEMLNLLEKRFIPLLGENSGAMQTPNHVDNTVFGIVPLQLYLQTGKQTYYDVGIDFADRQWTMPANPSNENRVKYQNLLDKGLSWQTRFWIDDMFMITAIQAQAYLASNDEKYINRAAHEMIAYLDSLQRPNGLFYHSPQAPFFWGRGNGWMAVGMADLLTYLPENNSDRPKVLEGYRDMMSTLKSYQNEEGLWNQLINEPDSWTETSGSAMFTYAMITGVKNGWLDEKEYAPVARKAWLALLGYLTDSFQLRDVCEGTNVGYTKEYYLARRRITGDRHGQAALMWCTVALYETEKNSLAGLKSLSYDQGTLIPAFNPEITEYTCYLPIGISNVTQSAEPLYRNKATLSKTVNVDTGSTAVTVVSADGSETKIYNINFHTSDDVDCTNLIVNNDFEYVAKDVPMTATTWKPKDAATNQGYTKFYGWECNIESLEGSSQGINKDFANHHGTYGAWISSSAVFPEFLEFYQTVDNLEAGTYKVQCLLSGTKLPTSQRLFANQNVQYFKKDTDYVNNQIEGEIATFAGYTNPLADKDLSEMIVYTTIDKNDPLKIGIRTGSVKGDGTIGAKQWGWFKTDYFRLIKITPEHASDANLFCISMSTGNLDFSPEKTDYTVILSKDTRVVTVNATANVQDAIIAGTGMVDVSSGHGISTITVTALDGITVKTYTITYHVDETGSLDFKELPQKANWHVANGKLVIENVDTYSVYSINGVKIVDVKDAKSTAVDLKHGVYIIQADNSTETFKVVVR